MTDWKKVAKEWFDARGSMGSFHFHLCYAITVADKENTERLKQAFPELVEYIKGGLTG